MRTGTWRALAAILLAGALGPPAAAASNPFLDLRRLAPATAPEPRPGDVRAYFLGISTLLFDDGETRILVDGFITRPGPIRLLLAAEPEEGKIDQTLKAMIGEKKIAAVMVSHAHYDHALDARYIAWKHGAKLIGSRSVAMIGDPEDRPAPETWIAADGDAFTCGRFGVTVLHGPHPEKNLARGEIAGPLKPPAGGRRYKASDSYAFLITHRGRRILVQPSADLPNPPRANPNADFVFLSIGMLGRRDSTFARDYWNALVAPSSQVALIHWDDPTSPAADLKPAPYPDFVDDGLKLIRAQAPDNRLRRLPIGQPVDLNLPVRAVDPATPINPAGVCTRSGQG